MSGAMKAADIRKAFLKPNLKKEIVPLPRLGIDVTVMEMDAARLDQYESLIYKVGDDNQVTVETDNMKAKIAVMSVVDDQGQLIFTPDDVEMLSHSYGKDVKLIAEKAAQLTKLFDGQAVEKNLDPGLVSDT